MKFFQILQNKPALIGLGAIALLSLIIAIPKGKPRNLDTPADALIGHWVWNEQHICFGKNGEHTTYNKSSGKLAKSSYEVKEQNVKDFSVDYYHYPLTFRVFFKDKGMLGEIKFVVDETGEAVEPTVTWKYVDDNVEQCGRK